MWITRVASATLRASCVAALTISCARPDATPAADSGADPPAAVDSTSGANQWVAELGQLLIVPSDSENTGVVIFPPTPSPRLISSGPLTLFTLAGDSVSTRAALVVSDSQVCGEAPTVRFNTSTTVEWSVGLLERAVSHIPMDSIEALPARDSLRLAAEIARLASSVPAPRESRFVGLAFVVRSANVIRAQDRQIVVTHLIRRLPQEASPIEEHTFIIAERPVSAVTPGLYVTAYAQRSEGTEETAEHFEVLSVVRGARSILLLLARDQETQTTYEIVERDTSGRWRSRWTRVLSC